jgi:hypothetical protein
LQGIQLATEKTSDHFDYFSLSDPATPLVESFANIREAISDRKWAGTERGERGNEISEKKKNAPTSLAHPSTILPSP